MKKIGLLLILVMACAVVILPTVWPLMNSSFFTIHDNTQVERVSQMANSLRDGMFPVRWVEDLGYGYGYPIFNFYAPLAYYVGGFLSIIFSNSLIATKIMFGVGIILSFLTMFLFARKVFGVVGGLVAATAYLYFPYHAVNIYVRGAVGEYYAYAFLPLVFWSLYSLVFRLREGKHHTFPLLNTIFLAISLALVILSHNLSALMVMIMLGVLVPVLLFFIKKKLLFILSVTLGVLLALALSAFYVLPAALESVYTNVTSQIGGGAFVYDHFICPSQLWISQWGFGGSVPGCVDGMSFMVGKLHVIFFIIGAMLALYALIKRKMENLIVVLPAAFLTMVSIILTLQYSGGLWSLPFMDYLQYPWRFLNFVGLFISLVLAYFVSSSLLNKPARYFFSALIIILMLALYSKYFSPQELFPARAEQFEDIAHIRLETSEISDEYMPKGFLKPQNITEFPSGVVVSPTAQVNVNVLSEKTGYILFEKSGVGGAIHINKAHFPSWRAYVSGEPSDLKVDVRGMKLTVPGGKHRVEIVFKDTLVQKAGNTTTILVAIIIIVAIIGKKKFKYE